MLQCDNLIEADNWEVYGVASSSFNAVLGKWNYYSDINFLRGLAVLMLTPP